jgi:hypothetical protein
VGDLLFFLLQSGSQLLLLSCQLSVFVLQLLEFCICRFQLGHLLPKKFYLGLAVFDCSLQVLVCHLRRSQIARDGIYLGSEIFAQLLFISHSRFVVRHSLLVLCVARLCNLFYFGVSLLQKHALQNFLCGSYALSEFCDLGFVLGV